MAAPKQLGKIQFSSLTLPEQQQMSFIQDRINHLLGYQGPIQLADSLDLGQNRITNVGPAQHETDVLTSGQAEAKYSAAALKPQLEAGSKNSMVTYRQINNATQRESTSSYLNWLMSTPPSASTVFPTITNMGGGVQVSIPASVFTFADGSTVSLQGRIDLLSLPAQYAISSLAVSAGVVTCNCAASGLIAGEVATIVPGSNLSFAGTFQLISSTGGGAVLRMQNPSAAGTDLSGYVQIGSIYYYSVQKRSQSLILNGSFTIDNAQNRLQVCKDGSIIVAVVTVTNSGAQIANSGGGGTPLTGPPASGSFF